MTLRNLILAWVGSLLFAVWTGLAVLVGAGLMAIALLADLSARGVL